ncbi:FAD-dependent monooxygenase [Faunimonas pinastri]|nr:FAD-dependent monooxygenase [Faunimonas pinastri]
MPLAADMASVVAVLGERAAALGAILLRGYTVECFEQDDGGVRLWAGGKRFDAPWLAGCDGGRSTVRKLAGIAFPGTAPEFTGYSVKATLGDAMALTPGRALTSNGACIHAPPDALGIAEWDGGAGHLTVPLTREDIEAVLRRVSNTEVSLIELHRATTWTYRACQAATYREDRVLLAGDAAHIHSPLGSQGLNPGIGDALALGRALVAVLRGGARPDRLDSYEQERRPIVSDILERSRAQVAPLRPLLALVPWKGSCATSLRHAMARPASRSAWQASGRPMGRERPIGIRSVFPADDRRGERSPAAAQQCFLKAGDGGPICRMAPPSLPGAQSLPIASCSRVRFRVDRSAAL